jgi:hypothetical protein
LIQDLIAASHGQASGSGSNLVSAEFDGIETAILAARRLQWGLEGFSDSSRSGECAAAILVQHATDIPSSEAEKSALALLEDAAPGQILVDPKIAQALQGLPSLQIQAAPGSAIHELQWRGSAIAPNRLSDEETISAFIQENGLESEAPPLVQESVTSLFVAASTTEKSPEVYLPAPKRTSLEPPDSVRRYFSGQRVLIGGIGGAVLLLIVIALVAFLHPWTPIPTPVSTHVPTPSVPAAVEQPTSTPGVGTQGGPSGPNSQNSTPTPSSLPKPSVAKRNFTEPLPTTQGQKEARITPAVKPDRQQAQQKEKTGSCFLESADVPKMLSQADNNRAAGHYEDALRQYDRVLACEPDNERARHGVDLTRLAMQHQ